MDELIAALETAREGSAALDEALFLSVMAGQGWRRDPSGRGLIRSCRVCDGEIVESADVPPWTRCPDAAMTLLPQGVTMTVERDGGGCSAQARCQREGRWVSVAEVRRGDDRAALAVCAVALKARAALRA
ncbi:MAG TPA: hypothetical protein VD978_09965 [Azospirillum sp.]|nr:hypothetical protein [Azospirillum sp.]